MKHTRTRILIILSFITVLLSNLYGHCEIPCGIYDDEMRIKQLLEHVTTIEKSMNQIISMENQSNHHSNQIVRWVMNKEDHAVKFQHIVTQYFMTQRIKPNTDDYAEKLSLLHRMLIFSMKCKQTIELDHVNSLRTLIEEFQELYFSKE